jgi:uncharacterized membrane protein
MNTEKLVNKRTVGISVILLSILLAVSLVFVKADLDEQSSYLCELAHTTPEIDIEECPAHTSDTSWYIMFAFGLVFLMSGVGTFMLIFSKPAVKTDDVKIQTDISSLDEEELQIYNLIKESEGSAYQSDLIKQTNFSKVKMTRILDKLESKKIIERKRRGMANIVILK